jgi:hypothetical protein
MLLYSMVRNTHHSILNQILQHLPISQITPLSDIVEVWVKMPTVVRMVTVPISLDPEPTVTARK